MPRTELTRELAPPRANGRFARAEPPAPPVRTIPRRARILLGAFGAAMLALLTLQLLAIADQRHIAQVQKERADRLVAGATRDLRDAREALPGLVDGLVRADRLVRGLEREDAPRALAAAGDLAAGLATKQRLVRLVDRLDAFIAEAGRRGSLGQLDSLRADADELTRLTRRSFDVQQRALDTQLQSLAILKRSLAVQEETLQHARNLDQKTGGQLAALK